MSFDIYIYEKSARENEKFNEESPPIIPVGLIKKFKERLLKYGYELAHEDAEHTEYSHKNESWGILVSVFPNEISFSIPYWEQSDEAIFEALMTASELFDHGELVVYDPQNGGWVEA